MDGGGGTLTACMDYLSLFAWLVGWLVGLSSKPTRQIMKDLIFTGWGCFVVVVLVFLRVCLLLLFVCLLLFGGLVGFCFVFCLFCRLWGGGGGLNYQNNKRLYVHHTRSPENG